MFLLKEISMRQGFLFLFRADMKKILLGGTNLVVDRYAFSGAVFSAAKPVWQLVYMLSSIQNTFFNLI